MGLNKAAFYTRTITAIVFAIVMLAGLLLNAFTFILLFSVIFCGCIYEFFRIIKRISPGGPQYYLLWSLPYILLPILLMLDLGIDLKPDITDGSGRYLPPVSYNFLFPCAIIFSIWINDTMAYIVGSLIGRTPFSKISPKKTWEGTIGGAILCILVIWLLSRAIPQASEISALHWVCIAGICAVFGTIGDLLESKLKRVANIKDSGKIMPGHGGFLDRFDSMLLAIPFVWLYVNLVII